MAFRLLIFSSHYRSQMNFTQAAIQQAQTNWEKIQRFIWKMEELAGQKIKLENREDLDFSLWEKKIRQALNDDLNSPLAVSHLYELISQINKDIADGVFDSEEAQNTLAFWKKVNQVFGFVVSQQNSALPKEIQDIFDQRQTAREKKDFVLADQLRNKLKEKGYLIEDTPSGQTIKFL